jgi:DNA polymerase-3 subunit gamma/tau
MNPPDAPTLFPVAAEEPRRSQALYRRYRSRDFDELVGQEPIVRTLQNALNNGRLAHAYLFCGVRGTGKTSTARLLAKAINCLGPADGPRPCNACDACRSINEGRTMDLIEIDAASNSGVDEIRELRERVNFRPSELRKKVYIIDEVHMLSIAAFNALLKTLEEPPDYVVFVLATTDPQKMPATVLSRCQRFDFRRIGLATMVNHLRYICEQEGWATEPGALELIARQSTGAMRDALTLLDQLMSYSDGTITLAQVQDVLGARGTGEIAAFVDHLITRDLPGGLAALHAALEHGADLRQFNRQVVEHLRGLLLLRAGGDPGLLDATADELAVLKAQADRAVLPDLSAWLRVFTAADANLKNALYGALPLEKALVEASLAGTAASAERGGRSAEVPPAPVRVPPAQPRDAPTPIRPLVEPVPSRSDSGEPPRRPTAADPPVVVPTAVPAAPVVAANGNGSHAPAEGDLDLAAVGRAWEQVVATLNGQPGGRNLAPVLRDMQQAWPVGVQGHTILIGARSDFFRSRLEEMPRRQIVEDAFSRVLARRVLIQCELRPPETRPDPASFAAAPVAPPPPGSRASKARAIFEEEDEPTTE